MNRIFRYACWKLTRQKTLALVGKSGTGKSFRSKIVAEKYRCQLIIDDGLLIKGEHIIAGRSAKEAPSMLGAVRVAVFDDEEHRDEVARTLHQEKFKKLLIIATSEKMVYKICERLALPQPEKIIRIEDIATREEIDAAMRSRNAEGKHVIPVPTIEVTRKYPKIVYDSLKVFFRRPATFDYKNEGFEKTIVRPEFSRYIKTNISEAAMKQMVTRCMATYDPEIKVKDITATARPEGYVLTAHLKMAIGHRIPETIGDLQQYIADSLENYANIFVASVSIDIEEWG